MADLSWIGWPVTVLGLGGTALALFRANIAKLIDRTDKGKVPGVEFSAPTQPQIAIDPEAPALPAPPVVSPVESPRSIELPSATPLVLQVEETLHRELETRAPADLMAQLATAVRTLAVSRLLLAHEANYRVIFSTQILLLKSLNEASIRDTSQAQFWYNVFNQRLPDALTTFDEWLSFLERAGYVQVGVRTPGYPSALAIDPLGRDFLLWMVHNGISEARPG